MTTKPVTVTEEAQALLSKLIPMVPRAYISDMTDLVEEYLSRAESRGASSVASAGDGREEYASEGVWRELNGLYEIAKLAWDMRTCSGGDTAGKLDEALDFFANVALKARMDRIVKAAPFPTVPAAKPVESLAGWIPVGERLPEDGAFVLAYAPSRGIELTYRDKGMHGEMVWYWPLSGYGIDSEATHWMPLPAPPAADNSLPAPPEDFEHLRRLSAVMNKPPPEGDNEPSSQRRYESDHE